MARYSIHTGIPNTLQMTILRYSGISGFYTGTNGIKNLYIVPTYNICITDVLLKIFGYNFMKYTHFGVFWKKNL